MSLTAEQKISEALASLYNYAPFEASILQSMILREDTTGQHKTFATDCVSSVIWSRAFVDKLTPEAVTMVLAHESWHKTLMHMARRGPRDPLLWNVANDYVINAELKRRGFKFPECLGPSVTMQQLIDGGNGYCLDPQIHTNITSEEVYDLLLQKHENKQGKGQGQGQGQGKPNPENSFDDVFEPEPGVDSSEQRVAADIVQAAMAARAAGNMPDSIKRIVGAYEKPTEPWRKIISQFVQASSVTHRSEDRSYARPSRRSPAPFVMPSRKHEPDGEYVIAIDTSGSITKEDLANYQAQINTIFTTVKPRRVHVVYCDAAISGTDTFERGAKVKLRMCGGGGTNFAPPFGWVLDKKIVPVCLVYFTDGYGPFPGRPRYPVLWGMTTAVIPPWGKVVRLRT